MAVELIGRILDYFLNPEHVWMFGREVHRAMTEFSGSSKPMDEESFEHFLDWFLFDFAYHANETPLAYAHRTNPLKFSDDEIAELKDIMTRTRFGYFEVIAAQRDGMTFADVENGERFEIADTMAAPNAAAGDVFLCRIAPVGGAWRVMNSSALAIRPTARDWERIRSTPVRDSRTAYREVAQHGAELPDISALKLDDGEALVSGGLPEWSPEKDDDCPICRVMRQAKAERRHPSHQELMRAFKEANAVNKRGPHKTH